MKKRSIAVLAAVALVGALAACGGRTGQETVQEEMVAPEVSSEDLLVSSLEYLLEDDGTETQEAGEAEAQDEPAGEQQTAPEENNAGTEADSAEKIAVYYGSGGSDELKRETVETAEVTPEELVDALARHNILSLDTKVLSFEQKEENGGSVLYLDLSKAADEYLRTMSEEAESVIIASVVNTFLENYDADAICLTVEGEPVEAAGGEHGEALARCTPAEVLEMLQGSDEESAQQENVSEKTEDAGTGAQP